MNLTHLLKQCLSSRLLLAIVLIMIFRGPLYAQKKYTASDIHSHNDYSRPNAFYQAFNAGAGAIEADVYLRDGKLVVAHDTTTAKQYRYLQPLYLLPVQKAMHDHPRPLNLLIDIKDAYAPALKVLLEELKPLRQYARTANNNNPLTIIITGNRPQPAAYGNYPDYFFFDDDLQLPHTPQQWARVAQVSLNFQNYSKWDGAGALPAIDEYVLKSIINAVHAAGKRVRFWAAPDTTAGWQKLMELHADILSTDKLDELKDLLKK